MSDQFSTGPVLAQRWVCLDIGETLIDETRVWATWAGVLEVTPLVLMSALGASIAGGGSYGEALTRLDPSWQGRMDIFHAAYGGFRDSDLYPDAVGTITYVQHETSWKVAVIGNQPARRTQELAAIGIAPDVIAMSEEIGAEKPSAAFFAAALEAMGSPEPGSVVYVGDRVDNDVVAATAAGLRSVHLRRGPWGILGPQADGRADGVVDDLAGLVRLLEAL